MEAEPFTKRQCPARARHQAQEECVKGVEMIICFNYDLGTQVIPIERIYLLL